MMTMERIYVDTANSKTKAKTPTREYNNTLLWLAQRIQVLEDLLYEQVGPTPTNEFNEWVDRKHAARFPNA